MHTTLDLRWPFQDGWGRLLDACHAVSGIHQILECGTFHIQLLPIQSVYAAWFSESVLVQTIHQTEVVSAAVPFPWGYEVNKVFGFSTEFSLPQSRVSIQIWDDFSPARLAWFPRFTAVFRWMISHRFWLIHSFEELLPQMNISPLVDLLARSSSNFSSVFYFNQQRYWYSMQCSAVQCSAVQCSAVQCSAALPCVKTRSAWKHLAPSRVSTRHIAGWNYVIVISITAQRHVSNVLFVNHIFLLKQQ